MNEQKDCLCLSVCLCLCIFLIVVLQLWSKQKTLIPVSAVSMYEKPLTVSSRNPRGLAVTRIPGYLWSLKSVINVEHSDLDLADYAAKTWKGGKLSDTVCLNAELVVFHMVQSNLKCMCFHEAWKKELYFR